MKHRIVCACIALWLGGAAVAQESNIHRMQLSCAATSTLVLPSPIKSMDIGSRHVASKRVPNQPCIIWLKAITESMPSTNITIVTEDDRLYMLEISFVQHPEEWVFQLDTSMAILPLLSKKVIASSRVEPAAATPICASTKRKKSLLTKTENGLMVRLVKWESRKGRYEFIWELTNRAAVPFVFGGLQSWVVTRNSNRRSAVQAVPVPLYSIEPAQFSIAPSERKLLHISGEPFWLSNHQRAEWIWFDVKGERSIRLNLKPRHQKRIRNVTEN